MRIVSLVPAATEIVAALGAADDLVAVSHDCDFPPAIRDRPRVTRSVIDPALPSAAIDRAVRAALPTGALYAVESLAPYRPDVVLTQGLCSVCAPAEDEVARAAAALPRPPRVVSLDPRSLADVLRDVRAVGTALGLEERAAALVASLEARIAAVRARVAGLPRRRAALLEWIDPPFCAGHWNPELVALAGGVELLGRPGAHAAEVAWDAVCAAAPEVLVLACCGFDVSRTLEELPALRARPGWDALPAVRARAVWAVDGTAYFTRPGPRLVDGLELLAALLHPTADAVIPPGAVASAM